MSKIRVREICLGRFWFAIRVKWNSFALGFALDWESHLWFTLRLGPLHFDVAYGERPHWS